MSHSLHSLVTDASHGRGWGEKGPDWLTALERHADTQRCPALPLPAALITTREERAGDAGRRELSVGGDAGRAGLLSINSREEEEEEEEGGRPQDMRAAR